MLLARHVELARRAAPPMAQQHRTRRVARAVGLHDEAVAVALDAGQPLAEVHRQPGRLHHAPVQNSSSFSLLTSPNFTFADDASCTGRGHGDLVARVVVDRAAERVFLLDDAVAQLVVDGRRARPDRPAGPQPTISTSRLARAVQSACGSPRWPGALLGRLADQPHAAQLAGDVDARTLVSELRADVGDVDAALLGAEHQADRLHRAGRQAGAVADAGRGVDQHRLA